jgi:S-adenosylmethionine-diacylglycerol 3-amino-3-carboxypropyl transferase
MSRIESRARFDIIRYANSWEDADLLCDALKPGPGRRILSIASAGDNAFAMLAEGAHVVAVDLSPAQLALVELKKIAIQKLDDESLLSFLGVRPAVARFLSYSFLREHLTEETRAYWDANSEAIEGGVIHAGRFENYFRIFRQRVLPLVHSKRDVAAMLQPRDAAGRRRFYDEEWNTWRWRAMFRVFFSRFVMGRTGRDPEFFRYVEGSVAERIFKRAEYALTELPTHTNPYLVSIFTGNYTEDALPRYLRNLDKLRDNLQNLSVVQGSIETAATGKFDGYYLSDIFEYIDPQITREIYGALLAAANPGARFAYWNLLVPRRRPEEFAGRVNELRDEAAALFARDMAFFYSAFVLEEVR